jgi:hypothetical protein
MCYTKNALVKSNSLATLKPTSALFVMVSQKDFSYSYKNIHLQGQLVFHYTHHMLVAHLLCLTD